MKWLLNLFRPKTVRLEVRLVTYAAAEQLLAVGWRLAIPEEDGNRRIGYVWLELRGPNPDLQK